MNKAKFLQKIATDKPKWELNLGGSALEIQPIPFKKHLLIGTDEGKVYLLDQVSGMIISPIMTICSIHVSLWMEMKRILFHVGLMEELYLVT